MRRVLEAIHEEKKSLRLQFARLDGAQALLEGKEPAEAARAAEPASRAPAREKKGGASTLPKAGSPAQSPTSAEVRDYVLSHGPTTHRQLLDALGGSEQSMKNKLKWLLSRRAIVAEGLRGSRRYLAPPPSGGAEMQSLFGALGGGSLPDPPPRGVYPLYDAILDMGSPTTGELARHLNKSPGQIIQLARRLLKLGLIRFAGTGDARRWWPTHPARDGSVK